MDSMFDKQKASSLDGVDLSRKGSIDEPIQPLISYINNQHDYFTTSSCSGRILIVDNAEDGQVKKKGCKWVMTSHSYVSYDDVIESTRSIEENAVFKFEPFVLHVQCRTLQTAQTMLQCGVASGFRNSGISVGNKGRFITAIRSTHSLDVPLSCKGKMLVSEEYMNFLVDLSNQKIRENLNRIERFFNNFKIAIDKQTAYSDKKLESALEIKQERKDKAKVLYQKQPEKIKRTENGVCENKGTDNVDRSGKESFEEIDICECLGFMDEG